MGEEDETGEMIDISDGEAEEPPQCSVASCIQCIRQGRVVLKVIAWPPFLFIYYLAAIGVIGYYLYLNYLIVLVGVAVAYLVVMAVAIATFTWVGDMKRYFRRHMHRIMIDLPKNLVVELKRKTKKHYKKAKKRVKDKAAALDRKMAKVNKELQALMKNMSSESKQQTMKLLAL